MNYFDKIKNFFHEDFSEVVGIYYDGEKIFLAHVTHKIELEEMIFEIDFTEKISPIEQLAEKIFFILNQRGWQNSKIGLCLNDDDLIIEKKYLNVPKNEIDSAVKTWASAQVGENAPYSFINLGDEVWAETLSQTLLNEYISAYEKNSLKLCALSAMPTVADENNDRAVFIAEVLIEKKSPNLLAAKVKNYNLKKIFTLTAAIFFISVGIFSIKLFFDYRVACNELETAKKILSAQSEMLVLKKNLDTNIAETKKIYSLADSQTEKFSKLNALIRIGKIFDNTVQMKKISANENFIQIDGVTDKTDLIEKFLRKLKNFVAENSVLENSAEVDGEINFTIKNYFGRIK